MAEGLRIPITVDFKNSLQKLNEAKKYFTDLASGADKSLGTISASASAAASALTPLAQAAASAKSAIIAFGEGKGNIEQVIPLFQELVAQAGGIDQAFEQLQDIPFFEEFVRGAEDAVLAAERLDGKDVKVDVGAEGVASVKTQLREANIELQNVVLKFGSTSVEAQKAAARVEELGDIIEESSLAVQGADFAGKFELAGRALAGVSSAFQTVTALQAVFGEQSKETEAALKKVQAVMALTQGIQGIIDSRKAVEALGASGVTAFKNLTTGIATATGASRGLAAAIAATGIGLLVVGIGLAISAIDDYNSKIDEAAAATGKLREENEKLGASLDKVFKSSAPEVERQKQIIINEEKIKDLQASGAENQAEVNRLRRENLNIAIKSGQVELATKKGIISADEELAIQAQIFRNQQELNRISIEETASAANKSAYAQKKAADELIKSQEKRNAALRLNEELRISTASDIQQKIFNIERDFEDKRKKLIEGGITDFTALEAAKAKAINDVINQANNESLKARQGYEKALFNLIVTGIQRRISLEQNVANTLAEIRILGIKDERERRLAQLNLAEQKEIDAEKASFRKRETGLLEFYLNLAKIRAKYAQDKAAEEEANRKAEEAKLETEYERNRGIVTDGIASLATDVSAAIAEGSNPFLAAFQSISNSLGSYLQKLGKDAILASKAIQSIGKLIGTPQGIFAGIALIALGTALKAAFKKKAEKGFATGGFVDGPGTSTSDSIPARLSKGEYVINAKSVRKLGRAFFDRVNSQSMSVFADGGLVTDSGRGVSRAIVNRSMPDFIPYDFSRAIVNRPAMPAVNPIEPQIIATTKVSGQDLKIILERAERRYSSVT